MMLVQPFSAPGHHPLSSVRTEMPRCHFSAANRTHAASPAPPAAPRLTGPGENAGSRPGSVRCGGEAAQCPGWTPPPASGPAPRRPPASARRRHLACPHRHRPARAFASLPFPFFRCRAGQRRRTGMCPWAARAVPLCSAAGAKGVRNASRYQRTSRQTETAARDSSLKVHLHDFNI